ncbi:DUF4255 domain-containing protein [Agarilytica rhodophyticola]|uniref:DUF4255 domain-containing protein n=1 Tax=Agarilytica rhodophyticola TaxID=1737490 RepID=UPI0013155DCF|nr:DUF4255 domain-containing protein [Agarilytica rhodophyticola]
MSSYLVVAAVSDVLRRVLWEEISVDPEVRQLVPSEQDIVFTNPKETAQNSSNRLSLWLYQISENEFMKNSPMPRSASGDHQNFTPLSLNLCYLITPFASHSDNNMSGRDENHLLLGKILQVFHDNAIVVLRDLNIDVAEELRVIYKRLTLEELTRIWEALQEPYRLSICYQIQVSYIDSGRVSATARIVERASGDELAASGAQS